MSTYLLKFTQRLIPFTYLLALTCWFAGCDDEESPGPDAANVSLTNNATYGNILVDAEGKTLYVFTKDVNGTSKCTSSTCLANWPVFYEEEIIADEGLNESDFGTITRDDGAMQTTYKGWPLYYYASDDAAGETNGEAVNNVWFVAKPDYSIMLANAQLLGQDGKNYTSEYVEGTAETQYFTDAQGRTLYIFTKDYRNDNNFTAADMSNNSVWPIFNVEIESLPSILNEDDFGHIEVAGQQQLTYKGWPLYYFGQDANRGENKGVSVPSPGVWPIANTDTEEAPLTPTVQVGVNGDFGNILTDNQGRTLYYFSRDSKGDVSACAGGCLSSWPIFNASEVILAPGSSLSIDDFGSIGDGATAQTTYKGWPLYYYSPTGDGVIEEAGETLGDGVNGVWYVAKPDYSLMIVRAQLVGNDGKNYTSAYTEGTGLTTYFTDAEGRTIYIFTNDKFDTNNFTAADLSNNSTWPIFHVDIDQLPSDMNPEDFGEIEVHGVTQLTFRGWPLYYFVQDAARGDNKGVSVPTPGIWPIVNNETATAPAP